MSTSQRDRGVRAAGRATRRSFRIVQVGGALLLLAGLVLALVGNRAGAATGPGASGNTIPGSAVPVGTVTPGPFDSGQVVNVVIPPNSVLTPGASIFILECAAPNGVDPTTTGSCDGTTNYGGGTISVNSDGSIDLMGGTYPQSTPIGSGYTIYALPDTFSLQESPASQPACGVGAANECVLYIGQGGGGDVGMTEPHFFSQPFQVHTDPTDSGTLDPGDGTAAAAATVSPTLSTVSPSTQTVTADGHDFGTVTVTLNGTNSAPVPGKTVSLTASGGSSTVNPSTAVTDDNGQATFQVTDTAAETETYTATDTTDSIAVTPTASITFAAPTVNLTVSSVEANPTTVPNDGTTASTVTVTLLDQSHNSSPAPIAGRTISLTASGGSSTITPTSAVTDSSGKATFSVTDAVNEVVNYAAKDTTDNVTLTSKATVTFGAPLAVSATASTVTANPSTAPTGAGGTDVTVTLLAADGTTPIAGKSVTLTVTSASGHAQISSANPATTNGSGQADFTVIDSTPEAATISAADTTDTVDLSHQLTVTFATPAAPTVSPTASTAVVSNSPAPADGTTEALVSITLRNTTAQASPMSGVAVSVTASPDLDTIVVPASSNSGTTPGSTNAQGQVSFSVRDTAAQTVTLTITAAGVTLATHPTAVFVAGDADGSKSTVAASPANVPADGSTASTVTVTLTDYFGNPVSGKQINLTGLAGKSVVTPVQVTNSVLPGTTNAQGVAQFKVTDSTSEVVTYRATDSTDNLTLDQLASVTFGTAPPVLPVKSDSTMVCNVSSAPANGNTAVTLTVELRDANGDPVTGKVVTLNSSSDTSVITAGPAGAGGSLRTSPTTTSTPTSTTTTTTTTSPTATTTTRATGTVVHPDLASGHGGVTVTTNSNGNAVFLVTDTVAQAVTYTATDTTDSMTGWTVTVNFTAATTTPATTTPTTVAPGVVPAPTGSDGSSSVDSSTSGDAGSSTSDTGSTSPSLAFTGGPALPWLFGFGLLLLLLGSLGRRFLVARGEAQ